MILNPAADGLSGGIILILSFKLCTGSHGVLLMNEWILSLYRQWILSLIHIFGNCVRSSSQELRSFASQYMDGSITRDQVVQFSEQFNSDIRATMDWREPFDIPDYLCLLYTSGENRFLLETETDKVSGALTGGRFYEYERLFPDKSPVVKIRVDTVSYTHLDVYKRQLEGWSIRAVFIHPGSLTSRGCV